MRNSMGFGYKEYSFSNSVYIHSQNLASSMCLEFNIEYYGIFQILRFQTPLADTQSELTLNTFTITLITKKLTFISYSWDVLLKHQIILKYFLKYRFFTDM